MADQKLLDPHDLLSEDDTQPPPYSKSKPEHFKVMDQGPGMKVQVAPLRTIYYGLFATIFCFWPCGLIAVIMGLQALQAHYRGELLVAHRNNTISMRFTIASIVLGIAFLAGLIAFYVWMIKTTMEMQSHPILFV